MNTRTVKGLLAAALVCFAAFGARAQDLNGEEAVKLKNYDEAVSTANPVAAKEFLNDIAFTDRLKLADPEKAAALISKAQAVSDLSQLLDKPWRNNQEMELSLALSIRIDFNKPLEKVGIGAVPETLLPWMAGYKKYPDSKVELVKRAIRQFEVVFGTDTVEDKSQWEMRTIRERNNLLADAAFWALENLITRETRTDKAFQNKVRGAKILKYLDPAGRARYERYLTQLATADAAKARLTAPQLNKIKDQPIEQQMYLLGGLFDKNKGQGGVYLERKVDGARQSRPGETLSFQNNQLLAKMLGSAMLAEVRGTVAGDKVAKFYASGARLDVAIESCQGCYAKYDPSSGRMIFDSELIQQYMRANDVNAETLVGSREQVSRLSKYLSPMLVHEGTHQMQHSWADKAGVYKPYVQEDEVEANSMEALYTMEKLKNNPKFKSMMIRMRASSSSYADKRLALAAVFSGNTNEFDSRVRQVYYPGLPSFAAASSQILSAVSGELKRRKALSGADLAEIEKTGIDLVEANAMTTQELAGSVGDIKTAALQKIQDDLLHKSLYDDHYQNAGDWAGSMRQVVKTTAARSKSKVPVM